MNRARYFNLGMGDMRQLGLSNISLQYYLSPAPADLGAAARAARRKYDIMPPADLFADPGRVRPPQRLWRGLLHLPLVDSDRRRMFTRFHAKGLRDPATADRYRKLVLEPGGTKPPPSWSRTSWPPGQPRCLSGQDGEG